MGLLRSDLVPEIRNTEFREGWLLAAAERHPGRAGGSAESPRGRTSRTRPAPGAPWCGRAEDAAARPELRPRRGPARAARGPRAPPSPPAGT